jgi:hypothetical protein
MKTILVSTWHVGAKVSAANSHSSVEAAPKDGHFCTGLNRNTSTCSLEAGKGPWSQGAFGPNELGSFALNVSLLVPIRGGDQPPQLRHCVEQCASQKAPTLSRQFVLCQSGRF